MRARADGFIETDGGRIPVEHAPFEAAAAGLACDGREVAQHQLARAAAACFRRHVQVFEIQAFFAEPRGVRKEVDAKADGLAVHFADERGCCRCVGEQACFDVCDGGDDFVLGLFVHREFGDEVEDERGVGGGGGAEVGGQGLVDWIGAVGAGALW